MSHVIYEGVMSHMYESWHIQMIDVCCHTLDLYSCVCDVIRRTSYTKESCHVCMSHGTYEGVIAHVYVMAHMNGSCLLSKMFDLCVRSVLMCV